MDFSLRSYRKELLDRDDIPFADIKQNMKELDIINANLGGHKITLRGLRALLQKIGDIMIRDGESILILEIGCGGGDNLRVIKSYCQKKMIKVKLHGVDINPNCIDFAKSRRENQGIEFTTSDYRLLSLACKPDIIFCSLFCHHFDDEEVVRIFKWMKNNSKLGFFINDLHRHPVAYYSIKWLTKIFSNSYLVKNDAPLSVLRGFKRNELERMLEQSCTTNAKTSWQWAFRWLIVAWNE